MTVAELIEQLEELNPEAEVRIASQPSWPMEYGVRADVVTRDMCDPDAGDRDAIDPDVVYLAEGAHVGYLPGAVAEVAFQ